MLVIQEGYIGGTRLLAQRQDSAVHGSNLELHNEPWLEALMKAWCPYGINTKPGAGGPLLLSLFPYSATKRTTMERR